jgi:hypothetical protein
MRREIVKEEPIMKAHDMRARKAFLVAMLMASMSCMSSAARAAERWQEDTFPAPNGGHLVFAVTADGNPACASYDGANCLWGKTMGEVDFARVKPLVCGAQHRQLYGVTGFEDPKHWCNLALRGQTAQKPPTAPAPAPAAGGYRLTEWSTWGRSAGVDYRYRVRWDPATGGSGKTVEVVYEVRNRGTQRWSGAARSVDCAKDTLWGSTDVALSPGQVKEVRVRAPNCGSATNPAIRPNMVRAGKFD